MFGAVEAVLGAVAFGMPVSKISHSAWAVTSDEAASRKAVARTVFMISSVVLHTTQRYEGLFARPCAKPHNRPDRCALDHIGSNSVEDDRTSQRAIAIGATIGISLWLSAADAFPDGAGFDCRKRLQLWLE